MPKNAVKPETAEPSNSNPTGQNDIAEPYSEKTALGGPIFKIDTYGPMPCRVQLSSKILAAAGLKPRDQVEIAAEPGGIVIRKIGEPAPGLPPKTTKSGMDRALDALMAETRAFEAEQRAARERQAAYREEVAAEDMGSLSEEQRRQETL